MTAAYSPRRHHCAGWVTMGPSETLMLESRAKTWYGRLGSGSRKWTRTPASSYTDTISACCFLASSGLKVRPLSRVARAMELAGSQWKLSGGQRRTSRRRPYSESTPQAGSARVVASIVGYHLSSWMPARCREYERGGPPPRGRPWTRAGRLLPRYHPQGGLPPRRCGLGHKPAGRGGGGGVRGTARGCGRDGGVQRIRAARGGCRPCRGGRGGARGAERVRRALSRRPLVTHATHPSPGF